ELGYEIEVDAKTGVFGINGVSVDAQQFFSKRRSSIEAHLEKHGLSGARAAEVATQNTKEKKKLVDRAELAIKWGEDAEQIGLDCLSIINRSYERVQKSEKSEKNDTKEEKFSFPDSS